MERIEFYRENTVNISLTLRSEGQPFDLSGSTIYFTVKTEPDENPSDSTAIIKKDITSFVDPASGKAVFTLTPLDTDKPADNYGFDIKLKKANDEQVTLMVGKIKINEVYTNRG